MATITRLPHEMIVHILENESISAADLMRFGSTCTKFQQLTHDNKLCEKKFYRSCPTAEKKYNREKQKKIFHHINFKEKIETGLYCIQKLQYYAFEMSENNFRDTDKEQLERLLRSIAENSMTYYFVLDEIHKISAQKSCELFFNLTREYNFKLIYCYLKQYRLIHKQVKFMNLPKTKSLLEKQLTIVAQYFQPHVSFSVVKTWLDNIAETVLSRLKDKYPAHSICSATLEQFSFWRDNNIDDNFWNETESKQIMCILEEYIFSELDIHKLHQLLMTSNLEVKYIKYITGCFRRYLLTVTYHIVARRLGIRSVLVQCIGTWNTIAVIWKPKYNTSNWDNAVYFYMNLNSNLLYPSNIIRERYQNNEHSLIFTSFSDISITPNLMMCLYREVEFNHKIYCEWNFKMFLNFLWQCIIKDVENINIEIEYKNITNTIEVTSNTVKRLLKRRTKKVKFAVGMIVTHICKDYFFPNNHDGVIIGWDYKCSYDIMVMDKLKETIMFPYLRQCFECYHFCLCQQFSASAHQVHYIILTENNKICYVQQDQLSICIPKEIDNIEIGRYFSSFEGTYYVPNESLRKHYPKDTAAIAEILAK